MNIDLLFSIKNYNYRSIFINIFVFIVSMFLFKYLIEITTHNNSYFGDINSPHSDALAPWLHGSLFYYFEKEPIDYLYRPTLGIFYSSLIVIFKNFYYIPYFFLTYYFVSLGMILLLANQKIKLIIGIIISLIYINKEYWFLSISPQSLNPDFFSFILVFIGLCFFLIGVEVKNNYILLISFINFGVSIAIRGLPLPGAILSFIFVLFLLVKKRLKVNELIIIIPMLFLLFFPIIFDSILQKTHGVTNNAIMQLYCYYEDPSRNWSPGCNESFLKFNGMEKKDLIFLNYINFLFSNEGLKHLWKTFLNIFSKDIELIFFNNLSFFLSIILLYNLIIRKRFAGYRNVLKSYNFSILLFLILFYVVSVLFFSILGTVGGDRTFNSVKVSLVFFLSYGLINLNSPILSKTKKISKYYLIAYLLLFLFLYSITFYSRNTLKDFNHSQNNKQFEKIALEHKLNKNLKIFKISDNLHKKISLWYSEESQLFYSEINDKELWKVYNTSIIRCKKGMFNNSYTEPCQIKF